MKAGNDAVSSGLLQTGRRAIRFVRGRCFCPRRNVSFFITELVACFRAIDAKFRQASHRLLEVAVSHAPKPSPKPSARQRHHSATSRGSSPPFPFERWLRCTKARYLRLYHPDPLNLRYSASKFLCFFEYRAASGHWRRQLPHLTRSTRTEHVRVCISV